MPLEPYNLPPATPENINQYGLLFGTSPTTASNRAAASINTYGGILPTYVSPIRPAAYTSPAAAPNPFAYSVAPRNNIFDSITGTFTSLANVVRTGASAIGDATRTYDQLRTTVRTNVQGIQDIAANRDTRGFTAAQPENSGNTLTIPYILPQGLGNNTNTFLIAGAAILLIVILMRK